MTFTAKSLVCEQLRQTCQSFGISITDQSERIYTPNQNRELSIVLDCVSEADARRAWLFRQQISDILRKILTGEWLIVRVKGVDFFPPWKITTGCSLMLSEFLIKSNDSSGKLAARLLDSSLSGAIVDIETSKLLLASESIVNTNGKEACMVIGQSLAPLWEGHEQDLAEIHQGLKQQGYLENHRYYANTWVLRNGVFQTESRLFHARRIEAVCFLGRLCRLTFGVEIVSS